MPEGGARHSIKSPPPRFYEAKGKPLEIWFQDEARIGQQGTLTRVWAKRGTRPRAPRDQRYQWAYLFGAVCPQRRAAAALVMPTANAEVMSLHLAEIARNVAPGAHAALVQRTQNGTQTLDSLQIRYLAA